MNSIGAGHQACRADPQIEERLAETSNWPTAKQPEGY